MELITAILLGAVQGVTEFLPVSSSGHLLLLEKLTGFQVPAVLFHTSVHLGSAVAAAIVLRKDVKRLSAELLRSFLQLLQNIGIFFGSVRKGTDPDYVKHARTNYRRLVTILFAASVPTMLIGLWMALSASGLMGNAVCAGVGFLLTGVTLLVSSMLKPRREMPKDVPIRRILFMGVAQGFSVLPGLSRFAVTYSGGILSGFSRKTALRVSLLLLLPAAAGAFLFEWILALVSGGISPMCLGCCAAGFLTSAVIGCFFMRYILRFVQTRPLKGFAYYCFGAGLLSVIVGCLL